MSNLSRELYSKRLVHITFNFAHVGTVREIGNIQGIPNDNSSKKEAVRPLQ